VANLWKFQSFVLLVFFNINYFFKGRSFSERPPPFLDLPTHLPLLPRASLPWFADNTPGEVAVILGWGDNLTARPLARLPLPQVPSARPPVPARPSRTTDPPPRLRYRSGGYEGGGDFGIKLKRKTVFRLNRGRRKTRGDDSGVHDGLLPERRGEGVETNQCRNWQTTAPRQARLQEGAQITSSRYVARVLLLQKHTHAHRHVLCRCVETLTFTGPSWQS